MTTYLSHDARPMKQQEPMVGERNGWFYRMPGITASEAQVALERVLGWSIKHFGTGVTMQRTPTGFGIQLLLRSLPEQVRYEPLPSGVSEVMHGAVGLPHRVEYFQRAKGLEYDARVAYLAHCRHVPVYLRADGQFIHDSNINNRADFYQQHRQGWYKCEVRVPLDWKHIGLVPDTQHKLMVGEQPTYTYPRVPGDEFTTWLHESEVKLLLAHSWQFKMTERILFAAEEKGLRGLDPLRAWSDKLASGILGAEQQYRQTRDTSWSYMRMALRSVSLQTIGQFAYNGKGRIEYEIKDGQVIGHAPADLTEYLARYHHPEWFSAITARTRVSATRMALAVKPSELLAIKADAIVTKGAVTLPKTGDRIGEYRCKGAA